MDHQVHKEYNRRMFLKTSMAAGLTSAVLPGAAEAADGEWRNKQDGMIYRRLGRTNMMISRVVMCGTPRNGPGHTDHLRVAMDLGYNYGDTAPQYKPSEAGYAEIIQDSSQRARLFMSTKVSTLDDNRRELLTRKFQTLDFKERSKLQTQAREILKERGVLEPDYLANYGGTGWQEEQVIQNTIANLVEQQYPQIIDRRRDYYQLVIDSVEQSLKTLKTDWVDQVMCPHGADTPEQVQVPEVFEAFEKLRKDGKVRFLGVSAHTDPAGILRAAMKTGQYHTAMVAYNVRNERWVAPAIKEAREAGMGIIAMKAGRLFDENNIGNQTPALLERLHALEPGDLPLPVKGYLHILRDANLTAVNTVIEDEPQARMNATLPMLAEG